MYIYITPKPFLYHSKTLLYSFREREKGPNVNKICKLFSDLNIYLHYHSFIHLQIAHEHIHLTPGSCTSVKYTQMLVKFCLIV